MTPIFSRSIKVFVLGMGIFLSAPYAHAATISFIAPANTIPTGAQFQIEVHLETGSSVINMVSGTIVIPDGMRITDVETGGSLFTLWPNTPMYTPGNRTITFSGGVPGGLQVQTDTLLFKITAIAQKDGTYQLMANGVHAYQNDGNGTNVVLPESIVTIQASGTVQPTSQVSVPSTPSPDIIPPVFSYAEIGKDPSLFNGAYYLTFEANDAESGIDHYAVKEGWFGSYVQTNQFYVLKDQTLGTSLIIRAVDKAGNIATWVVTPMHPSFESLLFVFGGGAIFVLAVLLLLRKRLYHSA